jgi:hypothetical protein
MGAKWSRALALLLCKEKLGLLEGLCDVPPLSRDGQS